VRAAVRLGEVVEFDDERGMGVLRDGDDGSLLPFHCTEIAGGSRTIEAGARVAFLVGAGLLGRTEARSVRRLDP
jgi:cold shock CspA family protein